MRNPRKFENNLENFDLFPRFSVQIAEIPKKIHQKLIGEFWTRIAKNEQTVENKTAKMRKSLTKFSRIF